MFKTTSGRSGKIQHVGGNRMRIRDAEFPSAPINVSDSAQTQQPLPLDMNIIRQFAFGQLDRPTLPERPSTAGGPANTANFVSRGDAWKRATRDDLDFPLPSHGKQTIFYDFPVPGGLPTPDSSPSHSLPTRKDSLVLSPPSDFEEEATMNAMEIGMAIGSPTHAPPTWQPQLYGHTHSPSPDPTEFSMDGRVVPPPKQKSKWKVFGGLFSGKKHTVQAQNFYQLQGERSPEVARSEQPTRGWTTSERSTDKKKPDVRRANTAPNRYNLQQNRDENPEIVVDGSRLEENGQSGGDGGLMLNVDIPNVEMERYSVMFGTLLGKSSNSTPSLLARRQATLDRLKVVNEELAIKEQEIEEKERQIKQPRRATSPQPTRSPAFSLFPNTPSRESRSGRAPSPSGRLMRSNTSPAALSPSRPSFAPGLDNEIHATLMEPGPHIPVASGRYDPDFPTFERTTSIAPKPLAVKKKQDLKSVVKMAQVQAASAPKEQYANRNFTPDQSHLTLSPDSDIYEASSLPSNGNKTAVMESTWQAVPRTAPIITASISGSTTSHSDHSASASGSSLSSNSITTPILSAPQSASSATQFLPAQTYTQSSNASSRSGSPQPNGLPKAMPVPMSKFTAPPQTHKTRGRSQTTSYASPSPKSNSQIPRPSSRPRAAGPTEISGPTNLTSTPLPVTTPLSGGSQRGEKANTTVKDRKENEEGSDEEARIERLADVSIARQISVSRQQRQLLVPIKGSFKGKSQSGAVSNASNTSSPNTLSPAQTSRPTMRARASTVSASTASPGSRVHDQNFPSPGQKLSANLNFGTGGVNVASVTSPLSAVEKAVEGFSPSSSSNLQKLKREVERERKEMWQQGIKASMPTLVIVGGNGRSTYGNENAEEQGWEGAVVNPSKKPVGGDGIAERRRRARAEKLGAPGEERKGHNYKKSEKVIVERV